MEGNEGLERVLDSLLARNMGEAIEALEMFLSVHPHQINTDRLYAIRSDYQLMTDYWRRGFKDPQLPHLYDNLLRRMYQLYSNIAINCWVRHSPHLSAKFLKANMPVRDRSPQVIREELESFVSDVAMLDLEPPHTSEQKRTELFARHHESMVELFYYILTSGLWTDGFTTAMEDILLSPTVDTNDQQLLISSVMLSSMNCFDMAKFRLLVHVYQSTTDEYVRQRALVGWVFSLHADIGRQIYPEEATLVEQLLEDEHCCQELVELQKQLVYCINAEKDHATIQSEIMPDLLKHQNFQITRNGIEEVNEDPLYDILHPDEEEKNLEKVEASFQKMMDMQKQGSDIYFGGFSQMKRFPFFNELSNWFEPFFMDHPDIKTTAGKFKNNRFLTLMMKNGPFCNSDKYSFLLAFEQVLNQVPQNVRSMLERGEAVMQDLPVGDLQKPAYIRRIYLQDLYRFFRLFSWRYVFKNIFEPEENEYLFFANPLFKSTHLEPHFNEIMAFLIKKKRLHDAHDMLDNYGEYRKDFQYYMMAGYLDHQPEESYARALELEPDSERALMGYARVLFAKRKYEEALAAYDKLLLLQPDKHNYLLNKSVCLTNLHRYDEAGKLLFKLNYERPDDENVKRVLAWTLTCDGKYDQAERLYSQLLADDTPSSDDFLNYGYCLWFRGNIDEAADCFHRYLKETGNAKEFILSNEKELIMEKGITEPEIQMMFYIL